METSNHLSVGSLRLYESGELARRRDQALARLESCTLCPHCCRVNRLAGELGVCRTGRRAVVASFAPHFGEESVLVGSGGSGTIFFSHCNLLCVFCQNYEISHQGEGMEAGPRELAAMMLELQEAGCHNINFVTPSHVVPQILEALTIAAGRGLVLPLVYNSSGFEAVDTLRLLDGVVDIYMPDFKFWNEASGRRLTRAKNYPAAAREAIREMHRQVGDLLVDDSGLARRGLLVRHLVMPGQLEETAEILRFLAQELSPATYVNLMDQYRPCGTARDFPPLDRDLHLREYEEALGLARAAGLSRLDRKDWGGILKRLGL